MRNLFAVPLFASLLSLAGCAPSAEPPPEPAAESAPAPPELEFETGKLISKVLTRDDPAQSYALYLPKGYDPARKYPVLYGFSPGARGRDPVYLFMPAAEKYGWILVGSNNSRNGPWAPIAAAIKAVMKDTKARLSIDQTRRCSTGFSGGARVAFYLAAKEKFAGVIPVGAGMGGGQKPPAKGSPLAVFSICGVDDPNHAELLRLEGRLKAAGLRQRMATFTGGHRWPPRELCAAALRYMELLGQLKAKQGDAKKVAAILELELKDAEALLAARGQYMRGHARLKELAGLTGDGGAKKKLAAVEASARYKKEKALSDELRKLRAGFAGIADREERFRKSVAAYRKFVADNRGSDAAARMRAGLRATGRSMAIGAAMLMRRRDYKRAEVYLKRARLFAPRSSNLAYNLACALARNGRKDEAVKQLAESVKLGFKDFAHIRKDPDLDTLREHPGYKKLLAPEKPAPEPKKVAPAPAP